MKRIFIIVLVLLVVFTGCKKEDRLTDKENAPILKPGILTDERVISISKEYKNNDNINVIKYESAFEKFEADLDNDGKYEIYSTHSIGYGQMSHYITAYIPESDTYSGIFEWNVTDYSFFLYNEELYIAAQPYYYMSYDTRFIFKPILNKGKLSYEDIDEKLEKKILRKVFKAKQQDALPALKVQADDIKGFEDICNELNNGSGFDFLSGELFLADSNYDGEYEIYSHNSFGDEYVNYYVECYDLVTGKYSILFDRYFNDYGLVIYNEQLFVLNTNWYFSYEQVHVSRPDFLDSELKIADSRYFNEEAVLDNIDIGDKFFVKCGNKNSNVRILSNQEALQLLSRYPIIEESKREFGNYLEVFETDLNGDGNSEIYLSGKYINYAISSVFCPYIIDFYNPQTNTFYEYDKEFESETAYKYVVWKDNLYVAAIDKMEWIEYEILKLYRPIVIDDIIELEEMPEMLFKEFSKDLYPYE